MAKVHIHELTGLKPDALATYLAALGIMRLVAEQKDARVRGFWRDEHFVLATELDWKAIERFLLEDLEGYVPTPILAPWNMESGFFSLKAADAIGDEPGEADEDQQDEGDEPDRAVGDPLLDRFAGCLASRFESLRRAILIARGAVSGELRSAEEAARRAHDGIHAASAEERAKYEDARARHGGVKRAVEELKSKVEDKQSAARGTAKGSSQSEELKQAQEELTNARVREKAFGNEEKDLKSELRDAEKRAKQSKELKARIADAKKRFKEIQSSTKDRLIADLRARWGVEGQQWVDAATALDEQGEAGFTPLFGSGGNDGRMEFTKNFRDHLDALFDLDSGAAREAAAAQLRAAIFGSPANLLRKKSVGQFFPGRAGGTNMGAGFSGGASVNPWEFVLMLEGAVALVAGMSRRGDIERARVSSPFWVEGASAGFGSASEREGSLRGEQWLPLWSQPLRYGELVELIREGRAQVGRRHTKRAADLVRATARLGLARGIDSLQRFAYLKRNGQSILAVSAGRFRVAARSHQALVEEVAPWIDRLVWQARDKNAPASLGVVAHRAQESLFSVCRQEAAPALWRQLLVTLGDAELVLLRAGKSPTRRPLPQLSSEWVIAMDDGTLEGRAVLRLAVALASQHLPRDKENAPLVDSVRQHFIPLDDRSGTRARFKLDERGRALRDPEYVCVGRDLVTDAIALVERRSIWARASKNERERVTRLALQAPKHCAATLEEIGEWVRGEVSDEAVLALARPLLALDWAAIAERGLGLPRERGGMPEPLHMLLRLAHLPFDVPLRGADGHVEVEVSVRLDPEPIRRLAAGDLDGALKVATRRLGASGLRPVFRNGVATRALARRLAASLAFPISRVDAARAARLVCKPYELEDVDEQPSISA